VIQNSALKQTFRYSFIFILVLAVGFAIYAVQNGFDRMRVILPLLAGTVIYNLAIESLIPFGRQQKKRPYGRDVVFTFFNLFITAKFSEILIVLCFSYLIETYFQMYTIFQPTSLGPLGIQVVGAILLNEFIRYWSHRIQHQIPALWKLHSIHHSVKEIYSLNTFYSHPFDYILRNSFSLPIVMLVGFSGDAVLIATAFLSVTGVFSHSRADFKFSLFNYVFSTNQLHRWHHSAEIKESNTNYGVCLSVWDLVFGTFFLPKDREAPEQTGLAADHPAVPATFVEVLSYPASSIRGK